MILFGAGFSDAVCITGNGFSFRGFVFRGFDSSFSKRAIKRKTGETRVFIGDFGLCWIALDLYLVPKGGLEPPRASPTTPSRWRVCQFHHFGTNSKKTLMQ